MAKEEITLQIPQDWNAVTIQMYRKFQELKGKKLSKDEFNLECICIMCNIDRGVMDRMTYNDINKIAKELSVLLKEEPSTEELQKKVEWNGVTYGFIPNLSEITLGEYVDIESYCKDAQKNLHKIMSILYRPIVKETKTRYSIEPYSPSEELEEEYLNFPALPSIAALNFFFCLGRTLSIGLVRFLRKERQMMRKMNKKVLH